MKPFQTDELARQFAEACSTIVDSTKTEAVKRAELAGTAKAYAFLIELSLGMHKEQEPEQYDDPALDPENSFCSCGRMTDNYPVICNHCRSMSSMD